MQGGSTYEVLYLRPRDREILPQQRSLDSKPQRWNSNLTMKNEMIWSCKRGRDSHWADAQTYMDY